MANITASMVKELRDKTGAGMMDCKMALTETGGDIEQAIDWLRKKGLSKAAKKADRVAADGLVGVALEGSKGALVEVNSETDFVARNESFQSIVRQIAALAMDAGGDLAKLLATPYPGKGHSVDEQVKEAIATIGENMSVRRTASLSSPNGVVASYIHNRVADNVGRIGVLVALGASGDKAKLAEIGRQIALHVAAANPQAATVESLDKALVERERAVYAEQALATGKPKEIVDKMVEGRLRKEFFGQVVLTEQVFMGPGGDGKITVAQYLKGEEKAVGGPIKVEGFVRYALGEGIEKKTTDFAAEVAALSKSN
jgi:elongation factor Ts